MRVDPGGPPWAEVRMEDLSTLSEQPGRQQQGDAMTAGTDGGPPSGLQALGDARPGLRDSLGDWLRTRFGRQPADSVPTARPHPAPDELEPVEAPCAPQDAAPDIAAPIVQPRRVLVVAAPHPATRRLYADIVELAAASEPPAAPVTFELATSLEDCEGRPHDDLIYLRSECSSGCRIAASLGEPEQGRLMPAAVMMTRLEFHWWERPKLTVEGALTDPAYLHTRLSELLGLRFGPAALELSRLQFIARAPDADRYCEPLGYMAALELASGPAEPAPALAVGAGELLARTLRAHAPTGLMVVAEEPAAALARLVSAFVVGADTAVHAPDGAIDALAGRAPGVVCLVDMVEAPRLAELVEAFQAARWMLCGRERSGEAVAELRSRCVHGGVDLKMTYVVEGADWKACPFGLYET